MIKALLALWHNVKCLSGVSYSSQTKSNFLV